MIRSIWATLLLLTVLLLAAPAFATSDGFVVASCPGTLGVNAYTAGQFGAIAVDVNGNTCTSGTVTTTPATPAAGTLGAGYPPSATPITGNAAGTTGAVVGTLAASATKFTYICGFTVSAVGSAAVGPITIAGLIGSSQVYQATASATGGVVAQAAFTPCIPSSAINTAITITTTADASATAVDVNSWGFNQ